MKKCTIFLLFAAGVSGKLQLGAIAEYNSHYNHQYNHQYPNGTCDPEQGWFPGVEGTGKCYMLIKSNEEEDCHGGFGWSGMNWFEAMRCCHVNGGYVAEPHHLKEQMLIHAYIVAHSGTDKTNNWWIGMTDIRHEDNFIWMSGQKVGYTNWDEGEPRNQTQDCVALNYDQSCRWKSLLCDKDYQDGHTHYTVCEKMS